MSLGFLPQPDGIAVSGTTVFVSHADGVSAFAEDGVEVVILADDSVREVVASANLVHVLAHPDDDVLLEMAHDGAASLDIFVAPPDLAFSPGGILSAGGRVYWTQEWQNAANDMQEHVVSVAFGGGDTRYHELVDADPVRLGAVVGDALYFYTWASGDIAKTSVSGNGAAELVVAGRDPSGLVASPDGLFWLEDGPAGQALVVRASLDGDDIDTIAFVDLGDGSGLGGLVLASGTLAWSGAGQLYLCRATACAPVAVGETSADRVGASEETIAWVAGNQVFRLPVPPR